MQQVPQDSYDYAINKIARLPANLRLAPWLVAVSFAAIIFWIFWAITSDHWAVWAGAVDLNSKSVPVKTAASGAWGDSFGAFNALVGALGFGAIAFTLHLQYQSFERQKIDQHISRFEDNTFRLIDLMRSLRENLRYEQTQKFQIQRPDQALEGVQNGHAAIEAAYNEVNHWSFKFHGGKKISRGTTSGQYNSFVHHRFEWCFAPYFRIIYTILNNIDKDIYLTPDLKAYYGNILRSQLTSFEIGLLAFNATSLYAKDLDRLLINFRMLKYLPKKRRRVLGNIFPSEAYQERDN